MEQPQIQRAGPQNQLCLEPHKAYRPSATDHNVEGLGFREAVSLNDYQDLSFPKITVPILGPLNPHLELKVMALLTSYNLQVGLYVTQ